MIREMKLLMLFQYPSIRAIRGFCSSTSSKNFNLAVSYTGKILHDKTKIVRTVSDEEYTRKWPQFYNSSIGEHIRHSCDHFKQVDGFHISHFLHAHTSHHTTLIYQYTHIFADIA